MLIHNAARAFAGAFVIAICAFGQFTTNTNIPTPTTTTTSLPPVGIGSMESVQVILTNTATGSWNGVNGTVTPNEAAPSCSGSVSFYNESGAIIGTATTFMLTSGEIAEAHIPYAPALAGSASGRELVRAVVSLTTTFPAAAPCSLSYSLATFDTGTGLTTAIITGTGTSGIVIPVAARL